MNLGLTLKSAREAKGLTPSELASKTRLLVQVINGLETNDYKCIPAPIYGRGFVKLYAEAVGLDPEPLRAAFTASYSLWKEGKLPPADSFSAQDVPLVVAAPPPAANVTPPVVEAAAQAATATETATAETDAPTETEAETETPAEEAAPQEEAAPVIEPVIEQPEVVRGLDLFDNAARPPVAQKRYAESPFATSYGEKKERETEAGVSAIEKFRTGLSSVSHGVIGTTQRIPRSVWRMALVVLAFLTVVALLGWGAHALYRLTATDPREKIEDEAVDLEATPPAAEKPKAKTARTPNAKTATSSGARIPALYID